MHRRADIILLSRHRLSFEATAYSRAAQRISVHAPDVVVVWTSAFQAIVVICLESFDLAFVGLSRQGDSGAWKSCLMRLKNWIG
jgi:hypothetical protein